MKIKIEKPKVFISYAWGSDAYNERVLSFATDLKGDGVDVVLDRWQLKEGFDTYAFMEKSVTDDSITNVLILLDPTYATKADSRKGGVGTETQIISPEVYDKVEQDKILPIVFKRGEDGSVCKPRYLKGRLHFDLTQDETYDKEYRRLVKRLFGIDAVKEPEVGKPPAWLEDDSLVKNSVIVNQDYYKTTINERLKNQKLKAAFEELLNRVNEYSYDNSKSRIDNYENLLVFREEFLLNLKNSEYVDDGYIIVIDALEECARSHRSLRTWKSSLIDTFVHELFIYLVAFWLKVKNWDALRYILNKTYFVGHSNFCEEMDSYNSFYCVDQELDNEMCKRDEKRYFCGTAEFWIRHIDSDTCSKREFILGDLLCYNASFLVKNYEKGWQWFPITYVYSMNDEKSLFYDLSNKMKSREHLAKIAYVMGYDDAGSFMKTYAEVEDNFNKGKVRPYRYNNAFDEAETFWQWIKEKDIGERN